MLAPPRNLLCAGLNYAPHVAEGDRGPALPPSPVIFTKPATSLIGPGDDLIVDTRVTQEADWEAELAFVVGAGGVNIPEDKAMDHVFGYTLANDVSARDLQRANGPASSGTRARASTDSAPSAPSSSLRRRCRTSGACASSSG